MMSQSRIVSHDIQSAYHTIQEAIDDSNPGDTIYVHSGQYFESLLIKTDNITILPVTGKVIITSAQKEFYEKKINWELIEKKSHLNKRKKYKIYRAKYELPAKTIDYQFVSSENDELYWRYKNMESFTEQYVVQKKIKGCYFDGNYVYISTESNPNKEALYIANDRVIRVHGVGKFTIDGGENHDIIIKNGGRHGISISNSTGDDIKIKNLEIINCHIGVAVYYQEKGNVLIENNKMTQNLEELPWNHQKQGLIGSKNFYEKYPSKRKLKKEIEKGVNYMNTNGVAVIEGNKGTTTINANEISGYFNGVFSTCSNTNISNNVLSKIGDDAIEIEGYVSNNKIFNNKVYDSFVCISLVPIKEGPVYIFNNIFINNSKEKAWNYDFQEGKKTKKLPKPIKFYSLGKDNPSSDVHFYNNYIYSEDIVLNIGHYEIKENDPFNSSFYNNLFVSKDRLSTILSYRNVDFEGNVFIRFHKKNISKTDLIHKLNKNKNPLINYGSKNIDPVKPKFSNETIQHLQKIYTPAQIPLSMPYSKELNKLVYPGTVEINKSSQ